MINTIGIKNFRSLKEIKIGNNEFLEIKPITILLGKNSSGKSSFLRIFPLLKQSVTSRTRGALALFGNEVDFGDFATTIFSEAKADEKGTYIEFDFTGEINPRSASVLFFNHEKEKNAAKQKTDISYKIRCNESLEVHYISDFSMQVDNNKWSYSLDPNYKLISFKVNGQEFIENLRSVSVIQSGVTACFPYFDDRKIACLTQLNNFTATKLGTAIINDTSSLFRWNNLSEIDSKDKLDRILSCNKKSSIYFRDESIRNFFEKNINEEF